MWRKVGRQAGMPTKSKYNNSNNNDDDDDGSCADLLAGGSAGWCLKCGRGATASGRRYAKQIMLSAEYLEERNTDISAKFIFSTIIHKC